MPRIATLFRRPGQRGPRPAPPLSWRIQGRALALALLVAAPAFGAWAVEQVLRSPTSRLAPGPELVLRHWWIAVAATLAYLVLRLRRDGPQLVGQQRWGLRVAYYGGSVVAHALAVGALAIGLTLSDPDWLLGEHHVDSVSAPGARRRAHLYDTSMFGCSFAVFEGASFGLRVERTQTLSVPCDARAGAHLAWPALRASAVVVDRRGHPIATNGGLPALLAPLFCTCCSRSAR